MSLIFYILVGQVNILHFLRYAGIYVFHMHYFHWACKEHRTNRSLVYATTLNKWRGRWNLPNKILKNSINAICSIQFFALHFTLGTRIECTLCCVFYFSIFYICHESRQMVSLLIAVLKMLLKHKFIRDLII